MPRTRAQYIIQQHIIVCNNRHAQGVALGLAPLLANPLLRERNQADRKTTGEKGASHLITLPPVGDVGAELLVAYDLPHLLNGRVRGH